MDEVFPIRLKSCAVNGDFKFTRGRQGWGAWALGRCGVWVVVWWPHEGYKRKCAADKDQHSVVGCGSFDISCRQPTELVHCNILNSFFYPLYPCVVLCRVTVSVPFKTLSLLISIQVQTTWLRPVVNLLRSNKLIGGVWPLAANPLNQLSCAPAPGSNQDTLLAFFGRRLIESLV